MQRVNHRNFAFLIGLCLLASGCAMQDGDFPSLAKRPYENENPIAEPTSEPTALSTSLPDSLRSQLNALVARHDAADVAFRSALPAARRAAQSAAGAAAGSESWVNAQMEISRLEKNRADSLTALAEIDQLVAAERDTGADAGLIALMEPSQERVRSAVDAQTAILVELTNLIG